MQTIILSTGTHFKYKPQSGQEAYGMLLESLREEIREKQDVLSMLKSADVRQEFIENWSPHKKNFDIHSA